MEAILLENPKRLQWRFPCRQNFCHCMLGMSTWLINIKQARVWIAKAVAAPRWLLMSMLFRHVQLFGGKSCTGHEITCCLLKGSDGQDRLLGDKLRCGSEAMLVAPQFLPEGWMWGSSCHLDWRCPACGWAVRGAVSLVGSPCSDLFCSSCLGHVQGASAHSGDGLLNSIPAWATLGHLRSLCWGICRVSKQWESEREQSQQCWEGEQPKSWCHVLVWPTQAAPHQGAQLGLWPLN